MRVVMHKNLPLAVCQEFLAPKQNKLLAWGEGPSNRRILIFSLSLPVTAAFVCRPSVVAVVVVVAPLVSGLFSRVRGCDLIPYLAQCVENFKSPEPLSEEGEGWWWVAG